MNSGLDDGPIHARLEHGAKVIRKELQAFPRQLVDGFSPMDSPMRTSSPPKGSQTSADKKLDALRGAMCAEMKSFYKARAWNDLCGGRVLSEKFYHFGEASTGASDIVPMCGLESALTCSQGMGTAAQEQGGTSSSAEAIMDCDLVAWQAACADGMSSYNANPKDPGYNQRAYGRVPIDCYCSCYQQCTMGQSSVLGAQLLKDQQPRGRQGAQCTLGQLVSGKCREPSST